MLSWRAPEKPMHPSEHLRVSVVYALPERQLIVELNVPAGATVAEVVDASGLRRRFPELGEPLSCAIFGRSVPLTHSVRAGDRVEVLRPLLVDPKESRRRAAAAARTRSG